MLKRSLYYSILPQLEHKNAIVITGMRQVGKTTLMKQLSLAWKGKYTWFDFDNPLDSLLFENKDYNAIYEELKRIVKAEKEERFLVCIDEIQKFNKHTVLFSTNNQIKAFEICHQNSISAELNYQKLLQINACDGREFNEIIQVFVNNNIEIYSIEKDTGVLEELFISLIKN